jgi:hypothetical protein
VVAFQITAGKPCGEARVKFATSVAVERCISHFSGCQWDASGTHVGAWLVPMASAGKAWDWQSTPRNKQRRCDSGAGATEASTEAGISEVDEEHDASPCSVAPLDPIR